MRLDKGYEYGNFLLKFKGVSGLTHSKYFSLMSKKKIHWRPALLVVLWLVLYVVRTKLKVSNGIKLEGRQEWTGRKITKGFGLKITCSKISELK